MARSGRSKCAILKKAIGKAKTRKSRGKALGRYAKLCLKGRRRRRRRRG